IADYRNGHREDARVSTFGGVGVTFPCWFLLAEFCNDLGDSIEKDSDGSCTDGGTGRAAGTARRNRGPERTDHRFKRVELAPRAASQAQQAFASQDAEASRGETTQHAGAVSFS